MTTNERQEFAAALRENLENNIIPYWLDTMSDPDGGFYGRRDGNDRLRPDAPRGAILNARILWTLSAAARFTGNHAWREAAMKQARYFIDHFIDPEYGGVYWSVDASGAPLDTRKQFYAIAFAIYGLSEYCRLSADREALEAAVSLFRTIEANSRDRLRGGYFEAAARDWSPLDDVRLSEHDLNSSKTMNTHLHILEAYANLLRVWPTDECREATGMLLRLFNDLIVDPRTHHLGLFFDDNLNRVDSIISYGHDIEASWLMLEAAGVVGDHALYDRTLAVTRHLAMAALEGRCGDGSMVYERHPSGAYDNDKHWWVQAEAVIGQAYLERFHGLEGGFDAALRTWRYIDACIVDHPGGEWHWSRRADGTVNRADDKAGFWKCPYHNGRMCIEAATILLA